MIEIKCTGRGGQGAVTFSQILAMAAFEEGFPVVQAMPTFGVERRGAPSFSFTRLSKEQCFGIRSQIYKPDIVIILDPSLLEDIDATKGLKKKGKLIINTNKNPKKLKTKGDYDVYTVDASAVASKIFKKDIVNTAMLGAFAHATKIVSLKSLNKGIEQRFEGNKKLIDLNKKAVKEVYDKLKA
ncbi:pyruvate ferredoxin oxidoreductase [Candidatus Woesearchaeota archaeon]|nr:pyruvate ferredoxin oxidoreductase [Candidatus Woesearchaeota archaeon]